MKLYAWQPRGHGPLSWFVVAENEAQARTAVEAEIERRQRLPITDRAYLHACDCEDWGDNFYDLTVAEPGQAICNDND